MVHQVRAHIGKEVLEIATELEELQQFKIYPSPATMDIV